MTSVGSICGFSSTYDANGNSLGFRSVCWDTSGHITQLGDLGTHSTGTTNARALAANDSNFAVGQCFIYINNVAQGYYPVRWNAAGVATQLGDVNDGTVVNGYPTIAQTINACGDAAGFGPMYTPGTSTYRGQRALAWKAGTTAAITLAVPATYTFGSVNNYATDYAFKLNVKGEAVGDSTGTGSGDVHATRWDISTGTAVQLIALNSSSAGTSYVIAYDANDSGLVAGVARNYSPSTTNYVNNAVVWGTDDQPVNLNSLIDPSSGWVLGSANSISSDDWVSGTGTFTPAGSSTSYADDFLLQLPNSVTGVPEPTTVLLFGLPFGIGTLVRRRRLSVSV